jgi:hypothetical protein
MRKRPGGRDRRGGPATTGPGSAARGRRLLVATAVAHYPKAPQWDRPGLAAARQQVIDLFTGVLGYVHVSDLGLDPTETQLTEHLRTLCRHRVRPEDHLGVYIAGHGEVLDGGGGRHVLLTADIDPDDIADALAPPGGPVVPIPRRPAQVPRPGAGQVARLQRRRRGGLPGSPAQLPRCHRLDP